MITKTERRIFKAAIAVIVLVLSIGYLVASFL